MLFWKKGIIVFGIVVIELVKIMGIILVGFIFRGRYEFVGVFWISFVYWIGILYLVCWINVVKNIIVNIVMIRILIKM